MSPERIDFKIVSPRLEINHARLLRLSSPGRVGFDDASGSGGSEADCSNLKSFVTCDQAVLSMGDLINK